jgi:hypothetical protein
MVELQEVEIDNESYFRISNSDEMRPFFMSIVSDSDHWMFIASNGGLTAGRKNAEYAIFPYYTDDKITESADSTGSKTIFRFERNGETVIWEPFSDRYAGHFSVSRNLYKNRYGNKIIFEEVNHDLQLRFRYQWSSSDAYGFVRRSTLVNQGTAAQDISLLDGLQNILPYGVPSDLQMRSSNLVDAYKRNELHQPTGLGIYALSAIIVDKAEPSEALKANVAWSIGLDNPTHLVSSLQLEAFRHNKAIQEEVDVKGEKGAYLLHKAFTLAPGAQQEWRIVVNVNQDHAAVAQLIRDIQKNEYLGTLLQEDIDRGTERLIALDAAADGLQLTADRLRDTRHFSNVLFNIMRGGTFDHNYRIERWDLRDYLAKANPVVAEAHRQLVDSLPEAFSLTELKAVTAQSSDPDFQRLCLEYLPLKFSRRHGDPSRPWNRFSINTRTEDGSKILDYEGNWRDIFQNWEALAHSYPDFIEGMICKFLNASTFDGYNPYRVTKDGFDWETIEPDDPWSYIGYWGDHQIIYLLKFLEFIEDHQPGALAGYFDRDLFVYANVPYKIKPYADLLENPKDTIDFDHQLDLDIRERRTQMGADGALLLTAGGQIHRVNFIEKILATVLAKMANFVPEGGIWMNTQRPEWNDANNALVGNGISMVTLYYLRRFLHFFADLWAKHDAEHFIVSAELAEFFDRVHQILHAHEDLLSGKIDDRQRKEVLDGLGEAAADYRQRIYQRSFTGQKKPVTRSELRDFALLSLSFLEHSIDANQRPDQLYHAYNLLQVTESGISVAHLNEMLEGQVAVLSAGYLGPEAALSVLDGMKQSKLFRPDQYSYLLYPAKELPGFLARNHIPAQAVDASALLKKLVADGNGQILKRDVNGDYHFNGNFKNANDLKRALASLPGDRYGELVARDREQVLATFEAVFNHKEFTGRSGTFYGYEGLGSIYWHMVSKLQLAVQECCFQAMDADADAATVGHLIEHYYEINAGIGVHKPPTLYGAFPTDPYSHTPAGKGAQQPGMTGQVKEDILSRFGELGIRVEAGCLTFSPRLLRRGEFRTQPGVFRYFDLDQQPRELELPADALAFTYCQVPIVYSLAPAAQLDISYRNGVTRSVPGAALDRAASEELFGRAGTIERIDVRIDPQTLI